MKYLIKRKTRLNKKRNNIGWTKVRPKREEKKSINTQHAGFKWM